MNYLKPFKFHGVEISVESAQSIADCPFCDKEAHFYIKTQTGQWHCKRCDENGNIPTFLSRLHELSLQHTKPKDYQQLGKQRDLTPRILQLWGFAKSITSGEWLIPSYNDKGKLANLSMAVLSDGKWKVLSSPECNLHPFGTHLLKKRQTTLWVAEGPWDGVALYHALNKTDKGNKRAIESEGVLAVPGAGNFNSRWLYHFKDRNVNLCYDNDHARKNPKTKKVTHPGWDGMQRVIKIVSENSPSSKSLNLLYWNNGKKPEAYNPKLSDSYDIRDLITDKGSARSLQFLSKRLKKAEVQNCRTAEVPKPQKIEVEKFPIEIFPSEISSFIKTVSDALPCPPDFLGTLILPALGTVIGNRFGIQLKQGWQERPVVFASIIAPPGQRKSPAFEAVMQPIRLIQKKMEVQYRKDLKIYNKNKNKNEKPYLEQIMTTDATIESLLTLLADNPEGMIFPQDELSAWTRSMSQYKQGKGNDRQHWLSLWASSQVVKNRVGNEPLICNTPIISVCGCIQPDLISEISKVNKRDDGFIQRVLFSYPESVPVKWTDTSISPVTQEKYSNFMMRIWKKKAPTTSYLLLDNDAQRVFKKWFNSHNEQLSQVEHNLRGVWAKLDGYCARFALILSVAQAWSTKHAIIQKIDKRSMDGAIQLVNYFKSHARKVYHRMQRTEDKSRIGKAVDFIHQKGGCVTARDIYTYKVSGVNNAEDAEKLLRDLELEGYGTLSQGERKNQLIFKLSNY